MSEERVERRLTTILAADVAGYARLMRANEEETLRSLTSCRSMVNRLIDQHRGRIANTAGDSVLAEFASAPEGVACALAIQQANADRNADLPNDRRMLLRIGVHLGEVMVQGGDLYGDAVNVAARLQSVAYPGGICVSSAVRNQLSGEVVAAIADAGRRQVKNIADPVHVFRVANLGESRVAPTVSVDDKPSIAVLPFTNMSNDPEQEFLGDGIAEDVITTLSRYPSLLVIARNSTFTYKGRAVNIK